MTLLIFPDCNEGFGIPVILNAPTTKTTQKKAAL
jgi:hypothetical protein